MKIAVRCFNLRGHLHDAASRALFDNKWWDLAHIPATGVAFKRGIDPVNLERNPVFADQDSQDAFYPVEFFGRLRAEPDFPTGRSRPSMVTLAAKEA